MRRSERSLRPLRGGFGPFVLLTLTLLLGACDLVYRPEDEARRPIMAPPPVAYQSPTPVTVQTASQPRPPVPQTFMTESIPGTITVAPGDQLYRLAHEHQISPRAIIAENNLSPPYELTVGQVLHIPHVREYRVQPGDTLPLVSSRSGIDAATIAHLNHIDAGAELKAGSVLSLPVDTRAPAMAALPPPRVPVVPAMTPPGPTVPPVAPAPPVVAPLPTVAVPAVAPAGEPNSETKFGGTELPALPVQPPAPVKLSPPAPKPTNVPTLQPTGQLVPPKSATDTVAHVTPAAPSVPPSSPPAVMDKTPIIAEQQSPAVRAALAGHAAPEPPLFAWPVRGPVVALYGPGSGGTRNEGINIAASEGADVIAAEAGTVTYAGDELRGFGYVVFIKHSGGWVTVYTHNASVLVHQGDHVRRGQPIAKIGALGNVRGPQLHFELREGTNPVDPLDHLPPPGPDAG